MNECNFFCKVHINVYLNLFINTSYMTLYRRPFIWHSCLIIKNCRYNDSIQIFYRSLPLWQILLAWMVSTNRCHIVLLLSSVTNCSMRLIKPSRMVSYPLINLRCVTFSYPSTSWAMICICCSFGWWYFQSFIRALYLFKAKKCEHLINNMP